MDIDGYAVDRLAPLFARCAELGIAVPEEMPLDTPEHQRAAVVYLGRLIWHEVQNQGGAP